MSKKIGSHWHRMAQDDNLWSRRETTHPWDQQCLSVFSQGQGNISTWTINKCQMCLAASTISIRCRASIRLGRVFTWFRSWDMSLTVGDQEWNQWTTVTTLGTQLVARHSLIFNFFNFSSCQWKTLHPEDSKSIQLHWVLETYLGFVTYVKIWNPTD